MSEVIVQAFVLAGSIFVLLAGIGVMRMPDLYMRLSTVTKGSTMGIFLVLGGVLIDLYTTTVLIKVVAVLTFGLVTSPVAAHAVSRAAYFQGVELWEGTVRDDLKGLYEMRDHHLASPEPPATEMAEELGVEHEPGEAEETDPR